MNKKTLHILIDMLDEKDVQTIYNVLIRFVAGMDLTPSELEHIQDAECTKDFIPLSEVDW